MMTALHQLLVVRNGTPYHYHRRRHDVEERQRRRQPVPSPRHAKDRPQNRKYASPVAEVREVRGTKWEVEERPVPVEDVLFKLAQFGPCLVLLNLDAPA